MKITILKYFYCRWNAFLVGGLLPVAVPSSFVLVLVVVVVSLARAHTHSEELKEGSAHQTQIKRPNVPVVACAIKAPLKSSATPLKEKRVGACCIASSVGNISRDPTSLPSGFDAVQKVKTQLEPVAQRVHRRFCCVRMW